MARTPLFDNLVACTEGLNLHGMAKAVISPCGQSHAVHEVSAESVADPVPEPSLNQVEIRCKHCCHRPFGNWGDLAIHQLAAHTEKK